MAMNQIISNVLDMKRIFNPNVIFVTGPGAVKDACALFHYFEMLEDKMRIYESFLSSFGEALVVVQSINLKRENQPLVEYMPVSSPTKCIACSLDTY
jgi:hypothetical protein